MAREGETLSKIKALLEDNPSATTAEVAAALGVSRQNIYTIVKREGIKLARGRQRCGPISAAERERRWPGGRRHDRTTADGMRLATAVVGGASELIVCADLLLRGAAVYRSVAYHCMADLVADIGGRLLRVEVRSARRTVQGHLRYPSPGPDRVFDVLALVDRDRCVTYRPDPFAS